MRITVLGGGHGSYTAAADLTLQGHSVTLWRRNSAELEALGEPATISLQTAESTTSVPLHRATADLASAVNGAELIVIPLPATSHADLAHRLAPHLQDGQVVYLTPGTFGTYLMARVVHESGNRARVAFAETGTLPYLTRKHAPQAVALTTRATNLPTGVFPASATDHALNVIQQAYPCAHAVEDALSAALLNAGPIIHPPLIILNAGPLNHSSNFDIHNEGTQPVVRAVTDQLDAERIAVRQKLGYQSHHYPLRDHYEGKDWMYGPKSHAGLVKSGDWREPIDLFEHRYMREDVELGLAFLTSVAEWAQEPAPIATSLFSLGGAICQSDFANSPRHWRNIGLNHYSMSQLKEHLHDGFR